MSQSPQTGQFNSYPKTPQNKDWAHISGLNPLKRVNSILTEVAFASAKAEVAVSQSPQTGQFNSYNRVKFAS